MKPFKRASMRIHKIFIALLLLLSVSRAGAQELSAKVTVIAGRISSQVDKRIFTTLQTQLANLLNNRKWTSDNFKSNEKIECNFILNLDREIEKNVYGATLTVQAARPVFNSSYQSPLVNWQDKDIAFRYVEYQPVEFNESRVSGSDGLSSNLTAIFAFYVYTILGMDYDSFATGTGLDYFKKAQQVVSSAPDGRDISGWKQFDGVRNRWWLAENFTNNKYMLFHDAMYQFYRGSLDIFYTNETDAREKMLMALNTLNTFNGNNQNTMMLQFFMQSKAAELIQMFSKAPPQQKQRAAEILKKIDVANANKYDELMK